MPFSRFNLLPIIILSSFLIVNCSASSSSQRYGRASTSKDEPKKEGRFSNSGKTNNERLELNNLPDSLLADEEFDELPVEETLFDKSKFVEKVDKLKSFNIDLTNREKILFEVIKYLDTPYRYGGNSEKGIDCSAFTMQVFHTSLNVELPRSTREQFRIGENISKDELKFGDLVFFNTTRRSYPGHVGIYLGDNQFIHASRKLGVTVSSLEDTYYKKRYIGARRIENVVAE